MSGSPQEYTHGPPMRNEAEIYESLARGMAAAAPFDAQEVIFEGKVHATHEQMGISWITKDHKKVTFALGCRPKDIEAELRRDIAELRAVVEMAGMQAWTHFSASLCKPNLFNLSFAHITVDDDWVGVYMRRVSDLTAEEAAAAYIPEKDWLERVHRRAAQEGKTTS